MIEGYDIVGDIHGEADALERLLQKLDYELADGCWQHPSRQAIFLGDFIDRGPEQKRVIETVMPMVQSGNALAVMGNHEFNALAFHTLDGEGGWLRPHTEKNTDQHQAFLDEYQDPDELKSVLDFFWSLPLWIELDGLRVVHACWDEQRLERLKTEHAGADGNSRAIAESEHQRVLGIRCHRDIAQRCRASAARGTRGFC